MFRPSSRGTHRAAGPAVIDYRALVAPVGRSVGGVAALGAVTATAAITAAGTAEAGAPVAPARSGTLTASLPIAPTGTAAPTTSAPTIARSLPTSVRLRAGARGDAVVALQDALAAQGASIESDGVFGARTEQAVRSLQRSSGLAVDGIVGPRTWAALSSGIPESSGRGASASTSTGSGTTRLRYGDRGSAVTSLQNALRAHGASFSATGYFGSQTRSAVRAFQASVGLTVDGVVGPKTWSALSGDSGSAGGGSTGGGSGSSRSTGSSSAIVALAKEQVGKRYVYGSSNPSVGFDCSGLVKYVYAQNGMTVPRTARQQVYGGRIISESEARVGDLVAFSDNNYGHIGIYAGNGMIVDASGSGGVVKYRAIWNSPHVFVTYR